jgi:hypothetical protein
MAGNRDGLMRLLGNDGENGLARLLGIRPFELITQLRRGSRGSDALIALHKVVGRDGMDAIGKLIKQGKRGGEGAGSVEDTMRNGGIGRIK